MNIYCNELYGKCIYRIRQRLSDPPDDLQIAIPVVSPPHQTQHGVIAALHESVAANQHKEGERITSQVSLEMAR